MPEKIDIRLAVSPRSGEGDGILKYRAWSWFKLLYRAHSLGPAFCISFSERKGLSWQCTEDRIGEGQVKQHLVEDHKLQDGQEDHRGRDLGLMDNNISGNRNNRSNISSARRKQHQPLLTDRKQTLQQAYFAIGSSLSKQSQWLHCWWLGLRS